MKPISYSFFSNIIDYAGLFPPARLPLKDALKNYELYTTGTDRWMLGKFICPVASLEHLTDSSIPYSISVVMATGTSFSLNLEKIISFNTENAGKKTIQTLEIKCVEDIPGTKILTEFISHLNNSLEGHVDVQSIFIELPAELQKSESTVIDLLAQQNRSYGIKLRCGGEVPGAFPSVKRIASSLSSIVQAGIPFKATAGLHHPFRHTDESLQVKQHGFINLFAAAMFLKDQKIDLATAGQLLEDEDQDHFKFEDERFFWNKMSLNIDEVQSLRSNFAISFGSCSFTEPLDDLRLAGLID